TCDAKDAPPVPLVWGDAVRFKQVLYNLLSNAIKFTPAGGRVSASCVATPDGKRVRTSVSDTGPGIAQDDLARLFTPFTQLDRTSDSRAGGTGLGLSLSKQLVELMDGRIGVESTLGSGAAFFVELPVHTRAAEDTVPARVEEPAAPSHKTSGAIA